MVSANEHYAKIRILSKIIIKVQTKVIPAVDLPLCRVDIIGASRGIYLYPM